CGAATAAIASVAAAATPVRVLIIMHLLGHNFVERITLCPMRGSDFLRECGLNTLFSFEKTRCSPGIKIFFRSVLRSEMARGTKRKTKAKTKAKRSDADVIGKGLS